MNIPERFSQSSGEFFNGKLKMENGKLKMDIKKRETCLTTYLSL